MDKNLDMTPVSEWGVFKDGRPYVIAGPCSAESQEQLMQTAAALKDRGVGVFRAGIWKPRTHPGCFEGVGEEGLPWLTRVREELGMKVCTEVAGASHVKAALDHGVDMVWIGARTTTNPFLVQEIAESLRGSGIPVLVKNPVSPDPGLWIGAVERLRGCGISKIAVIHRGFSTLEPIKYRYAPEWRVALALRSRYPGMAFFCDPSHMAGSTAYVGEIAQTAMDLGLDGLMIESHISPSEALSDASQQLTPAGFAQMMESLSILRSDTSGADCSATIEGLRAEIDSIDRKLLELLASRMELSREIGIVKKNSGIAIIQLSRWESMMEDLLGRARELGLDETMVRSIFENIHQASILVQKQIRKDYDSKN